MRSEKNRANASVNTTAEYLQSSLVFISVFQQLRFFSVAAAWLPPCVAMLPWHSNVVQCRNTPWGYMHQGHRPMALSTHTVMLSVYYIVHLSCAAYEISGDAVSTSTGNKLDKWPSTHEKGFVVHCINLSAKSLLFCLPGLRCLLRASWLFQLSSSHWGWGAGLYFACSLDQISEWLSE